MPKKSLVLGIVAMIIIAFLSCSLPKLPTAGSKFLDTSGNFTLYVSNQSFDADPVDIRIKIDDELVVSGYFWVGDQHKFTPFRLSLSEGQHRICIWSLKGKAQMISTFEVKDHDIGIVTFWYSSESRSDPTPSQFEFHIEQGPLIIM